MVNASGISSQPTPDGAEPKSAECPPDNKLPENSQENLDARLDHAIEKTFPTSDPVSVTITKGPEPDRSDQEARASSAVDQQSPAEQGSAEHVLDQGVSTAKASATRGKSASSIPKLSAMFVRVKAL
jgi:hypothetical protein